MQEAARVEDLHHGVPLQLAGHGAVVLAVLPVAAPEHPALAEPLDEDALAVGPHQNAPLQVAQQLAGDLPLALVVDEVGRREVHALHGVGAVAAGDGALLGQHRGDAAALGVGGHRAMHQLAPVVEGDHHLGEHCWGCE